MNFIPRHSQEEIKVLPQHKKYREYLQVEKEDKVTYEVQMQTSK